MRFFCSSLRESRSPCEIAALEEKAPAGISHKRFCDLMHVNRSTKYYKPKGISKENASIMDDMRAHYEEHPTAGVLTMRNMLKLKRGLIVNPKRIRRLMAMAGLRAITPERSLSKGGKPKYVHKYLLRGMEIERPNQVWSTDISYIPAKNGNMYLYAIMDVYSRYIVGWRLSNTLSASNCIELLDECVVRYGTPDIVNSDQGSQYTSKRWVGKLEDHGIKISMDGKGRCKDNIWIERFWRTVKQEYIYINPADDVDELRKGLAEYIAFYNQKRPHQSLDVLLPAIKYGKAARKTSA